MEGDNDLIGSLDKVGFETGKEMTEVVSKEIVVHTTIGPTLMAASKAMLKSFRKKTTSEKGISSGQEIATIQHCSHELNKERFLKGC